MNQELWIKDHDLSRYESEIKSIEGATSVAGYLGTATDEEGTDQSLECQAARIRELCNRKFPEGCRIFWIVDRGVSGNLPYRRPGLEPGQYRTGLTIVTQLIERGLVRYVCIYNLSRFSRSAVCLLDFMKDYLEPYKIQLLSATEQPGRDDVISNLAGIMAVLGDFSQRQAAQFVRDGISARRDDGYWIGKPPYGWECQDRRRLRRGQRISIEPIVEQAATVRKVFKWYLSGKSSSRIAARLNQAYVPSPSGDCKWIGGTITRILKSPIHAGLVKNSKGECVRGAHYDMRIIDESTFRAALKRINQSKRSS